MEGNNNVSVKRKIWEMVNPFVFFFVCLEVSAFIVYFMAGMVYVYTLPIGVSAEEFMLSQSFWCYFLFYVSTIVIKGGQSRVRSEFIKYGHSDSKWKIGKCIAAAFLAVVAAFVTSTIITLFGLNNIFTSYTTAADLTFSEVSPMLLIVTVAIAGPIAEELIFRYMTFGRIRYYAGSKWAIIISAVMFGVYHGNIIQFIYGTIIGIIFAAIYDRSGNIWIVIGAHMCINMIGISVYI